MAGARLTTKKRLMVVPLLFLALLLAVPILALSTGLPPADESALAAAGPKVSSYLQWANTDFDWVSGNLGASKSRYLEGDSIPYYAYVQ